MKSSDVHCTKPYLKAVFQMTDHLRRSLKVGDLYDGKTVFVTGATGQLGAAIVYVLCTLIKGKAGKVFAACRDKEVFERRFSAAGFDNLQFVQYEATMKPTSIEKYNYIIHCAGYGDPAAFVSDPVGVMKANITGLDNLLHLLAKQDDGRILYISSGEVYGQGAPGVGSFAEEYCGMTDTTSFRSCYPIAKKAGETLCASYKKQFGIDYVIARQCHVFGPGFSKRDSRVTAEFLNQASAGKPIVMKSSGLQRRSYMFELEAAAAYLYLLAFGYSGEAYNVAPNSTTSIKELALMISSMAGVPLSFEEQKDSPSVMGFGGISRSVLDNTKITLLGWEQFFSTQESIAITLEALS